MSSLLSVREVLARPPRRCPNCRVRLLRAHPQCPACGEALTPKALKARAEAAAQERLGLPARKPWELP